MNRAARLLIIAAMVLLTLKAASAATLTSQTTGSNLNPHAYVGDSGTQRLSSFQLNINTGSSQYCVENITVYWSGKTGVNIDNSTIVLQTDNGTPNIVLGRSDAKADYTIGGCTAAVKYNFSTPVTLNDSQMYWITSSLNESGSPNQVYTNCIFANGGGNTSLDYQFYNSGAWDNSTTHNPKYIVHGSYGACAGAPVSGSVSVDALYPANAARTANTSANIDLVYNTSEDNMQGNLHATLWVNSTGVWVNVSEDTNPTINGTDVFSGLSYFANETDYYWKVEFGNGTTNANTTARYFQVDRTNPLWSPYASNRWAQDNTTVINKLVDDLNFTANYSWFDSYMNGTNTTYYNSSGATMFSNQTTGLTCQTCNFTYTLNLSTWAVGVYTVSVTGTDDHTIAEIGEYNISSAPDTITFQTPTANVTITNTRAEGDVPTADKLTDRYNFSFGSGANATKTTWTFVLTSTRPLYHRDHYPFPAFVTGQQWVDFNTGFNTTIYEVRKEDDYTYEIEIETEDEGDISFNSIGGLNRLQRNMTFQLTEGIRSDQNLTLVRKGFTFLNVSWDSYPEATEHVVLIDGVNVANVTDTNYSFLGLQPNTEYNVSIHASNGSLVNNTESDENRLYFLTSSMWQVENITGAANNGTAINLSWDVAYNTTYVELWRDTTNIANLTFDQTDRNSTSTATYADASSANFLGFEISLTEAITLKSLGIYDDGVTDANRTIIRNSSNDTIAVAPVASGVATFNTVLAAGTYYILADANTSSYNYGNNASVDVTYPYTDGLITFVDGCSGTLCGGGTPDAYNIEWLTYFPVNPSQNYTDGGLAVGQTYQYTALAVYNESGVYSRNASNSTENQINVTTATNTTITVFVRNEVINEVLTGVNVTLNFLGTTNYTYSTTTGNVTITSINTDNYTIRHSALGWGVRDQYLEVRNNSIQNITLYLINNTERTGGVIEVVDRNGQDVTGAVVKLLRYFGDENAYRSVQHATTSYGQTEMDAELYDAYYKWVVEYNDNTVFISTNPENLNPDGGLWYKTFTVNLNTGYYQSYVVLEDIANTLTYNATSETFTFTWNDPHTIVTEGCLDVTYVTGARWTLFNRSCGSGATGSVFVTVTDGATVRYKAAGRVETNTAHSTHILATIWNELTKQFDFGNLGVFLGAMVLMGGALLFSFSAIATVLWVVIATAIFTFNPVMQLFPYAMGSIVGLATLGLGIGLYLMRR